MARTISTIFGASGAVAKASLARNSPVAPGSPPSERRQLLKAAFQHHRQRGIEGKCQPVEEDDVGTWFRDPHPVHDPRPHQQDVAGHAHAVLLERDRIGPSHQHRRDDVGMHRQARNPDGQDRAGER
jgi:hypothetical protein